MITLTTPPNGAVYVLGQNVTAAFGCTDSGSGVATCSGTAANGSAVDTSTLGPKSFTVNSTDDVPDFLPGNGICDSTSGSGSVADTRPGTLPDTGEAIPGFDWARVFYTMAAMGGTALCIGWARKHFQKGARP